MTLAEALAIFGLDAVPQPDALALKYRELAKTAHPDAGGSLEAMVGLSSALAILETRQPGTTADADKPPCRLCNGRGTVRKGAFGSELCTRCDGTGFAAPPQLPQT